MAVLLPAPFGPISPVTIPFSAVNEQRSTALMPPKCLLNPSTWRAGAATVAIRLW